MSWSIQTRGEASAVRAYVDAEASKLYKTLDQPDKQVAASAVALLMRSLDQQVDGMTVEVMANSNRFTDGNGRNRVDFMVGMHTLDVVEGDNQLNLPPGAGPTQHSVNELGVQTGLRGNVPFDPLNDDKIGMPKVNDVNDLNKADASKNEPEPAPKPAPKKEEKSTK